MNMENNNPNVIQPQGQQADVARSFMAQVFTWMAVALGVSGFTAYLFGNSGLIHLLITDTGMSPLGWIVMFAPLAFVLIMTFGMARISTPILTLLFVAYSIVTGMSLSFIFLIYTSASIASVFGIAAFMFGAMALAGYTTHTDLTGFGSILRMAFIGLLVAMVINMFLKSSQGDYIISFIGVLIFTGLTAYDVQKLKRIGAGIEYGSENTGKLAIMGALNLYLDFINLFLFLLRLFGRRK
jgi:FtsH-binding integral membrane protein